MSGVGRAAVGEGAPVPSMFAYALLGCPRVRACVCVCVLVCVNVCPVCVGLDAFGLSQ